MSEKVLQEYSQRIMLAKNMLETTKSQCAALTKEALRLEKEYDELQNEKKNHQMMEENLKNQYLATKNVNDLEREKNAKEYEELNQLREMKKKLRRENDICKADCAKNTLILEDLVNERQHLEKFARQLAEQLEQVTLEKHTLQEEHERNDEKIQDYHQKITEVRNDIKNMKKLIATSFGKDHRGAV